MDEPILLRIITSRDDGSYVRVIPLEDGALRVILLSRFDQSETVDYGIIKKEDLYQWISDRVDY